MKTKEIKGWIYKGSQTLHERFPDNFDDMVDVYKAKLIIELPERKLTISESEYNKAIKESFGDACYFESLKTLREKLFGKE
jgi:hypothetical protein